MSKNKNKCNRFGYIYFFIIDFLICYVLFLKKVYLEDFMFGCYYFRSLFNKLDYCHKLILLSNIFDIKNITVFSISIRDNKLIIRLYQSHFFIQYVFVFKCCSDSFITDFFQEGVRCYYIYPERYEGASNYSYYLLSQLLLSNDREEIKNIFNSFLNK